MKKTIIATLVGAIIIFVWQMMSWMFIGIHNDAFKYTAKQDTIMTALSQNLDETGMYRMPMIEPEAAKKMTMEDHQKYAEQCKGKPYAMIMYVKSFDGMMPMQMIMGFIHNLLSVLAVVLILGWGAASINTFGKRFMVCLAVAAVLIFNSILPNMTWMGFPMHYIKGEIIDAIIGWALVGLWLGRYYKQPAM